LKHLILIFMAISFLLISPVVVEAKTSVTEGYKVGAHDVIDIRVFGHDDLRTLVTVADDGSINFPYLGTVSVKGMRLEEIEKTITQKLSDGFIKFPMVSVTLVQTFNKKIFTYGDTRITGGIFFEEGMTVVKAILLAGGTEGLYGKIKVRHGKRGESGYKEVTLDLKNIIEGSVEGYMLLEPDDILLVEEDKIFIYGDVAKKDRFPLKKDMTVLRALLEAGGVTIEGLYGKIKVRRKQKGEPDGYKDFVEAKLNDGIIESHEVENTLLQPDDIVIVERSKTFLIQGEVVKRGQVVLEKDVTVLRALLGAGGVTIEGLYGKIKVRRKQEGETIGYKDFAESKLNDGVIESKEVEDTLLQPDDVLIVERNKTYFIYGEVNKLGEFVLQDNMTVFKAITMAGGFTKWGSGSRVKVLRPTEDGAGFAVIKVNIKNVIDGDAAADVMLKPRDIIVVSSGIF